MTMMTMLKIQLRLIIIRRVSYLLHGIWTTQHMEEGVTIEEKEEDVITDSRVESGGKL